MKLNQTQLPASHGSGTFPSLFPLTQKIISLTQEIVKPSIEHGCRLRLHMVFCLLFMDSMSTPDAMLPFLTF